MLIYKLVRQYKDRYISAFNCSGYNPSDITEANIRLLVRGKLSYIYTGLNDWNIVATFTPRRVISC